MTNGLILLGVIAFLIALVIARVRRRMGMAVNGRYYAVTMAGIAIVVLILWATRGR
ncbi:MAG TPA: hypothetical protein VF834_23560 [Streptosporangiaceae bacterium]